MSLSLRLQRVPYNHSSGVSLKGRYMFCWKVKIPKNKGIEQEGGGHLYGFNVIYGFNVTDTILRNIIILRGIELHGIIMYNF